MIIPEWASGGAVIIAAIGSAAAVIIGAINARNLKQVSDTGKATHALVNSDHGVSLRLAATTLRRIAGLTNDPADIIAANEAKLASDNHDLTQSRIDRGDTSTPTKQQWSKLP